MSEPEDNPPPQPPDEAAEPSGETPSATGAPAGDPFPPTVLRSEAAYLGYPPAAPESLPPPGPAIPDDLRTAWSWPDLILFLVFVVGSSVILPLLAGVAAVAWWGVKPWDIDKMPGTKAAILVAGQAMWSVATMLYLFGTVRLRNAGPFWRAIGWRALRPRVMTGRKAALLCVLGGVGLAVAIQISSVPFGKKSKLPIEEFFQNRRSVLLLMALGILVAPFVEETIFRGYIYPVVARGFGIPLGVFVTGLLFGLVHVPQLWGGWGQIALIIVVGIVLTSVRARTGTVLASFLVHISYNSMLFAEFYLVTGGLRHFPAGS